MIQRGADVNHVDRFGMTPLQHAASMDSGESAMIDLLRRSGAKPKPKALELARKYGYQNLLRSLGSN